MNIKIEYKKGILFIRPIGIFNRLTYKTFNEEVFPIVLKNELKYIVINFEKVKSVDGSAINSLDSLFSIIDRFKGKISLCNLNDSKIKNFLIKYLKNDNFYETKNELSALEMFEL
ncbi:MAG: STAS domain-containing protein [Bacilli bacterium]|nr:STAS domain-containing protein [Bacilli bacterium]